MEKAKRRFLSSLRVCGSLLFNFIKTCFLSSEPLNVGYIFGLTELKKSFYIYPIFFIRKGKEMDDRFKFRCWKGEGRGYEYDLEYNECPLA